MKTSPLTFTEENFRAVLNSSKTETRRLSNGSDKAKCSKGDLCYLTEPTEIIRAQEFLFHCDVKYFWHEDEIIRKFLTPKDKISLDGRKTGYYSKQIARFMLKSFARYWVEITDVKLERLLDITAESAIAEGIKYDNRFGYFDYIDRSYKPNFTPIQSYISQIGILYGKEIGNSNPWVWTYKFKLCDA